MLEDSIHIPPFTYDCDREYMPCLCHEQYEFSQLILRIFYKVTKMYHAPPLQNRSMDSWEELRVLGVDTPSAVDCRAYFSAQAADMEPAYDYALALAKHHIRSAPETIIDFGCNRGFAGAIAAVRAGWGNVPYRGFDILPASIADNVCEDSGNPNFTYTRIGADEPLAPHLGDAPGRTLVLGLNVLFRATETADTGKGARHMLRRMREVQKPGDLAILTSNLPYHAPARHQIAMLAEWDTALDECIQVKGLLPPAKRLGFQALKSLLEKMPGYEIEESVKRFGRARITEERFGIFTDAILPEFFRTYLPKTREVYENYQAAVVGRAYELQSLWHNHGLSFDDTVRVGAVVLRRTVGAADGV